MSHDRSSTEEEDKKPQIILDYNKYKGGVDMMDHLATNYSYIRIAYDSIFQYIGCGCNCIIWDVDHILSRELDKNNCQKKNIFVTT